METDIRRMHFFDGLFLRQAEFETEQGYHLHMRRRMNYMLFDGSGVVQIEPGDLRITPVGPVTDRTFRVSAGMANSRRDDLREGREIVLRDDSPTFDLDNGFGPGQEVFVAIHYEDAEIEPQTGVEPNMPTRVEERAVISLHNASLGWPPTSSPPDGESYILLGRIAYDTMTVDETPRQTAFLRSSLIGTIVPPGAPTITMISPNSAMPSDSPVTVQITGTNLNGATVAVSSGTGVAVAAVPPPTTTMNTIDFTLTIAAGAAAGARTISVDNGAGTAATSFEVLTTLGVPVIDPWSDAERRRRGTETLTIRGNQFAAPMQVVFPAAVPTDPDVVVTANVVNINEATVIIPGPQFPTVANPAVVRSGVIRVTTPAGTSAPSPTAFILEVT